MMTILPAENICITVVVAICICCKTYFASAALIDKVRWNLEEKTGVENVGTGSGTSGVSGNARFYPQPHSRDGGVASGSIFRAFWNVPNTCGVKFGINLPLADYGIEFNSNHKASSGNVVTLLGQELGMYPYFDNRTGETLPVNGGLAQLANITAHLEKSTADILAAIPDPNFNGIGVIDWEAWRPQWEQNFDTLAIYQEKSIAHVRNLHPGWDDATVALVAKLEWTQGAKLFLESTLILAKELRPKAMWGYYHFPYCFNNKDTVNMSCSATALETNNDIMWLFNASSAIFPSIYLRPFHKYEKAYVRSRLTEAFRVRDRSSNPEGVVLSYARFNYSHTNLYYNLEDLNNTILQSAELGVHGVVFWGDNFDDSAAQTCSELHDYINNALGPTLLMARQGATSCSERVCSGHGRCVGNILTCGKGGREGNGNRGVKERNDPEDVKNDVCSCRCFKGWQGNDCSPSSVAK